MNFHLSHGLRLLQICALILVFAGCNAANVQDEGRAHPIQTPTAAQPDVPADTAAGDPERGAQLFTESVGGMPSCSTCHAVNDAQIVGPGMARIGDRAERRVDGMTAEEYLHTSIVDPGAYVVEGFQNVMPDVFEQSLSEAQIRDLIAYLGSL